jgi:5-methylcytosine-specific restriction endonuclease McrA
MTYKGMSGWKALGFKSYREYLESNFWKQKRELILNILGRKCSRCGSTIDLQVHHLNYINCGNESRNDVIVLCRKCHKEEGDKNENKSR